MKQYGHLPSRRAQRGAVMIMFGLMLVVLIGFAGLAIDLGRFFVIKSELQNAMDACALSAASQLRPGYNTAADLTRAVAYGRVFTTGGTGGSDAIRNKANFQSTTVNLADSDVTFAETINGPYATASTVNVNAHYAKCDFSLNNLPIYFMRVLNLLGASFSTQTVSAMAVAKLTASTSACAIPIAVCSGTGNNYGYTAGDWVTAKSEPLGDRGVFGWINFSQKGGDGTQYLRELLRGPGLCSPLPEVTEASEGNRSTLDDDWNSRFGYYDKLNPADAIPDFTGYAYSTDNSSGSNVYSNYLTRKGSYAPYQGNIPTGIDKEPSNKFKVYSALNAGNTKPRRIAMAPIADCSNLKKETDVKDWACVLMLNPIISTGNPKSPEVWDTAKVEFLGLVSTPGSPCASAVTVLGQ